MGLELDAIESRGKSENFGESFHSSAFIVVVFFFFLSFHWRVATAAAAAGKARNHLSYNCLCVSEYDNCDSCKEKKPLQSYSGREKSIRAGILVVLLYLVNWEHHHCFWLAIHEHDFILHSTKASYLLLIAYWTQINNKFLEPNLKLICFI